MTRLRRVARQAAGRDPEPSLLMVDAQTVKGRRAGRGSTAGASHRLGVTARLELALVDRGTTARAARAMSRRLGVEIRRVFWPDPQPGFRPIAHAWRVEVAHGLLARSRRLAKSFQNTTNSATGWLQVACVALLLRQLSA
jgi:hypothetical protein